MTSALGRRNLIATAAMFVAAHPVLIAGAPATAAAATPPERLTVFAAASLTEAFKDVDAAWQAQGRAALRMSFAASSTLARQIEQGAEANMFASADEPWMAELVHRNLIADGTRRNLLGNALVLVMATDHLKQLSIGLSFDIISVLGATGRLAVGDTASVPAGIYAKQALTRLGLWTQVEPRLAPSDSVRSALLLVSRGEAPAGIVYSTDAAVMKDVGIAGEFPESSHDPIVYPFALTRTGDNPEARALLDFVSCPAGFDIFAKRGFTKPPA